MMSSLVLNGKKVNLSTAQERLHEKLPGWERDIYAFLCEWWDTKDFVIVQTSGSTGAPKQIQRKKAHMRVSANMTGNYFGFTTGQKVLLCLPAKYIAGKMMLVRAIEWGLELDYIEPKINLDIPPKSYYFSAMTPPQAEVSLLKINDIKKLLLGGAPVSKSLELELANHTTQFFVSYGMTETVSHIAIRDLQSDKPEIYQALESVWFETDSNNQLIINAPNLVNEPLKTTDCVSLIHKSQFIWEGRADFIINSGGFKIFPEKVEDLISELLTQSYIIHGKPDDTWGQIPILLIEGASYNTSSLQMKMKHVLSKNETPKEIFFIDTFDRTENGKINRNETFKKISHS